MNAMRLRHALLLVVCLGLGCDMADYQRRMNENRARLEAFDKENRYLDKPLRAPFIHVPARDKEPESWIPAWSLFLRLPRKTEPSVPEKGGLLIYKSIKLYKYPGDPATVFVAVDSIGADPPREGEPRYPTVKEFQDDGYRAILDYARNSLLANLRCEPNSWAPETPAGPKGGAFEAIHCETVGAKEELQLDFYHRQSGDQQVLIVFQHPRGRKDGDTIKLCLATLGVGDAAGKRRAEFSRLHPGK